MKIEIENTVTVKVSLNEDQIRTLITGGILHEMMETEADEKPMYICISKELSKSLNLYSSSPSSHGKSKAMNDDGTDYAK